MNKILVAFIASALCLSTVLSGCLSLGGGDETVQQTKTTTTGQELIDLKAAFDKGIINERQYEQQKDKLLRGK
jgi:hypothetical protein